jgi:hypothetical protein
MKYFEKTAKKDYDYVPFVAGTGGGVASAYAVHPLDTVLTTKMTKSPKEWKDFVTEMKKAKPLGKVKRLYQGVNLKALKVGLAAGISFPVYEGLKKVLKDKQ